MVKEFYGREKEKETSLNRIGIQGSEVSWQTAKMLRYFKFTGGFRAFQ